MVQPLKPSRKYLEKSIYALFFILALTILGLNIFFGIKATEKLLPSWANLLLGCGFLWLLYWLFRFERVNRLFDIRIAAFILLLIQLYIIRNIFFLTGWDVFNILRNGAMIAANSTEVLNNSYFSAYPNNIFLVWLISIFARIESVCGFWGDMVFSGVVFQCVLSAVAGYALYSLVLEQTENKSTAMLAWSVYALLTALSPWMVVLYTDAMGLSLPILIVWIFQKTKSGKYLHAKWATIALLSYWGYRLKPQIAVASIAILLTQALYFFRKPDRKKVLRAVSVAAIIALCLGGSALLYPLIVESTGLQIDQEKSFGVFHFVMMGLNPKDHGVWSEEDVTLSSSFETKSERTAAQIAKIQERLSNFGFSGLMDHLYKKSRINFTDGSFSWGNEGNFYFILSDPINDTVCPFLQSLFYTTGENYKTLFTFEQMLWMTSWLFCLPACFRKKKDKTLTAITLSLVGIILFVTLFEARGRYLFIYSPLLAAQGAIGFQEAREKLGAFLIPHLKAHPVA